MLIANVARLGRLSRAAGDEDASVLFWLCPPVFSVFVHRRQQILTHTFIFASGLTTVWSAELFSGLVVHVGNFPFRYKKKEIEGQSVLMKELPAPCK